MFAYDHRRETTQHRRTEHDADLDLGEIAVAARGDPSP
jgi:hypothetical protein